MLRGLYRPLAAADLAGARLLLAALVGLVLALLDLALHAARVALRRALDVCHDDLLRADSIGGAARKDGALIHTYAAKVRRK
ncbi:hypothetical protein [Duganella sp. HH105]|uniref:hypothetical protein n=1 Tax=Duganella sp. HH105 TaxID=1781067 RepID=UPI001E5E5584|nr:hypothetical protein [Duganella sp. HH105]